MNIRIKKHKYDKNYDENEYCIGCCNEFESFEECIKFVSVSGYESFMCIDCFDKYKKIIETVN